MTLTEFAKTAGIDDTELAYQAAIDLALSDLRYDDEIDDAHPRFFLHVAILMFGQDAGVEPAHPHLHAELNAVERATIRLLQAAIAA